MVIAALSVIIIIKKGESKIMKYGKYIILILFGIAMFCFGIFALNAYEAGGYHYYDAFMTGMVLGWIFSAAGIIWFVVDGIIAWHRNKKDGK